MVSTRAKCLGARIYEGILTRSDGVDTVESPLCAGAVQSFGHTPAVPPRARDIASELQKAIPIDQLPVIQLGSSWSCSNGSFIQILFFLGCVTYEEGASGQDLLLFRVGFWVDNTGTQDRFKTPAQGNQASVQPPRKRVDFVSPLLEGTGRRGEQASRNARASRQMFCSNASWGPRPRDARRGRRRAAGGVGDAPPIQTLPTPPYLPSLPLMCPRSRYQHTANVDQAPADEPQPGRARRRV